LDVQGNISYYTQQCARYSCQPRIYYNFIGTWDSLGNLLSQVDGQLPAQPILFTQGTEQVYAQGTAPSGPSTTGRDIHGFGYVDVPASHYHWVTPSGQFQGIQYAPPTVLTVVLQSDGDPGFPLNISSATLTTISTGAYTPAGGTATFLSTDCQAVAPGSQCSITVQYDPSTIAACSAGYYWYTQLALTPISDAGTLSDWTVRYTIGGQPRCEE
jgi:hypothetical protein